MLRSLLRALALAVAVTLVPVSVSAQGDDWSAKADPGKRAEIIKRYKQILEGNPSSTFVLKQLVKAVGYGRQLEQLVEEYREKARKNPTKIAFKLIEGHLLKEARRYTEAVEAYSAATRIDPNSADAWLGLGLSYELDSRPQDAGPALEKALGLVKDKARKLEILRDLAELAFGRNDFDSAKRYYEEMIRLDPGNDYLRKEFGAALRDAGRFEESLEQYLELKRRSGRNVKAKAEANLSIGELYVELGRIDEALALWRQTLNLVTGDSYVAEQVERLITDVYRTRNELPKLIAEYKKAGRTRSYAQLMTLASLYDETGQEDEALATYKAALAKNRSAVDARLKIIRLLERRGDTPGVIAAYRALVKAEPRNAGFAFELAELLWRKGDKRGAEKIADGLARSFASAPEVQANVADLYLRWGLRAKVLAQYQKLARLAPNDPSNVIHLGEFYWQEGDRKKALETWKKILRLGNRAEAHASLAEVYANHNLISEAVAAYEEALRLDPENVVWYRALALVHEKSRDLTRAEAAWRKLLETAPQRELRREARSRIIRIYQRQNALRARVGRFKTDFEKSPPDKEAGYFLGESYLALSDWAGAERVFGRLLEIDAKDLEALIALDRVYRETNDFKKNIEVLARMAEIVTTPAQKKDLFHRIAELNLKLYQDGEAVKYAVRAVDLNQSDPRAHARLADVYAKMQSMELAAAEYRTAIELDPQAFPYYFKLAEIYLAMDRVEQADGLYRSLLGRSRDESMVVRAGRKSIDINDALGKLEQLEGVLVPIIAQQPGKPVFRRLLIEVYDRLTRTLIASADYGPVEERARAEAELNTISRRALGPLLAALEDDDLTLRMMSIRILGNLRNGNAALPLARLIDDEDPTVRVQALLSAGKIGDPRAAGPLIKATTNSDRAVREIATWALGRTGSASALGPLRRIVREEPEWTLRALAAISLGRLGKKEAVPDLAERLASPAKRDARAEVRVAAAWGLGALGEPAGRDALVRAAAEDRDPNVRRMATWALGNLRTPEALEELLRIYWTAPPAVREVAGKALLRFGPAGGPGTASYVVWEENLGFYNEREHRVEVEFLLRVLLSDELLARASDGRYAITRGEAVIARLLLEQLSRDDPSALTGVLYDLDQRPDSLALGALTWTLPTDKTQRNEVLAALGRIGAGLVPRLLELLGSDTAMVRAHSAGVLGKVRDARAVSPLIAALADKNEDVRRKAARALGQLGDKRALDPLVARLGDGSWMVRSHAATAVGQLGDRKARSPLISALDDEYPFVQAAAADGLGYLGDRSAVAELASRVDKASPPVRRSILQALERLGGPEAQKVLERYHGGPGAGQAVD
jgi:cellulose synthase operon protein C